MNRLLALLLVVCGLVWGQVTTIPSTGSGSGGTFASQAEAEAGTNTTNYMNPLRTSQAIAALGSGLADPCKVQWTSASVITIAVNATTTNPCIYAFDNTSTRIVSPATATYASGTSGTLYIYVTASGVQAAGSSTGSIVVTCSAGCTQSSGSSGFPAYGTNHIALATATVTTGAFDALGVTYLRPNMGRSATPIAGTGLSDASGTWSVSGLTTSEIASGSKTGTGTKLATTASSITGSRCAQFDTNGTLESASAACGTSTSTTNTYQTSLPWPPQSAYTAGSTQPSVSNNQVRYRLLTTPLPGVLTTKVVVYIATGVAAATCHIGFYDSSKNRIAYSNTLDAGTSSTWVSATFAQSTTLTGANYWAWSCTASGVRLGGIVGSAGNGTALTTAISDGQGSSDQVLAAGVMPSSLGTLTGSATADQPFVLVSSN
jgi:hypothetical protein